jgi:hypothetical protein
MREFLITKFVCADCGNNLELSTVKPQPYASKHSQGEPSGAYMLQQLVPLHPCRVCMQPLFAMRDALKTLEARKT